MNLAEFKKLNIPDNPGVYTFKHGADVLYIGKATSLKERLRSYFNDDLIATRGRLLVDMITRATTIEFEVTDSVLEAFIRETELIKKYQPPFNSKDKDNKSFNYVVITDEDFPRVLTMRGRNLEQEFNEAEAAGEKHRLYKYVFGPYPYGNELKEALKIVRRIFPFRDTCIPAYQTDDFDAHSPKGKVINKPCFNCTIGLCPGVCTGEISKTEYTKTIQHIRLFFSGKKSKVLEQLRKEMMDYAKKQEFERANDTKRTIFALEHIKDVSMIKRDADVAAQQRAYREANQKKSDSTDLEYVDSENIGTHETEAHTDVANSLLMDTILSKKKKQKKDVVGLRYIVQDWQGQEAQKQIRIESYDIAHMSGKDMVGVMVVMTDGEFDRSQYRKFIINDIDASNDTGALVQVICRRFAHFDWKWPDLIVVDGGQAQLDAVRTEIRRIYSDCIDEYPELARLQMPDIVSVVKDDSHKAREILNFKTSSSSEGNLEDDSIEKKLQITENQIISLNAETHRFAITFHKKKREDAFLPKEAKELAKKRKVEGKRKEGGK